jgi:hypothetical protein
MLAPKVNGAINQVLLQPKIYRLFNLQVNAEVEVVRERGDFGEKF